MMMILVNWQILSRLGQQFRTLTAATNILQQKYLHLQNPKKDEHCELRGPHISPQHGNGKNTMQPTFPIDHGAGIA